MNSFGNKEKRMKHSIEQSETFSGTRDISPVNESYNKLMYVDTSNDGTFHNTQLMPLD